MIEYMQPPPDLMIAAPGDEALYLTKAITPDVAAVPVAAPAGVTAADLNTWEVNDDQLSYEAAVKIGFPVVTVDASMQRRVLVRDVRMYKRIQDTDGGFSEWGVSIRLVLTVFAAKLDGQLTVPIVAARAQLSMLSASAHMLVVGFKDAAVAGMLPSFEVLDVAGYGKYTAAADQIRGYISKHESGIDPVLLRRVPPVNPQEATLAEATGTSRALRMIARGRSRNEALQGAPAEYAPFVAALEATYEMLTPGAGPEDRPDDQARTLADRWATLLG